jgi:hypothetical protein
MELWIYSITENLAIAILKFILAIARFIYQSAAWFAKVINLFFECLVPLESEQWKQNNH